MEYSTHAIASADRISYWRDVISGVYFPLDTMFANEQSFRGEVKCWSLGLLAMTRLDTDAILYRRHERQLVQEREQSLLITIPEQDEVSFTQSNRETCCRPGGFLIERGDAPYEFSQRGSNSLWVLKAPSSALRARIGPPERFSALTFDAARGVGACFVDMVRSVAPRLDEMSANAHDVIGLQLVDLLCLAIRGDERALESSVSSVRAAHLFRAERHICANLAEPNLEPQAVADACGISLRYLQRLFTDSGRSVGEWIREQRLVMCDEELRRKTSTRTISEIAYRWGFADQSQFSKHYRTHFGRTPSEARSQYRLQRCR